MQPDDRMRLFDEWAAKYDEAVAGDRGYPFAGYEQVHEAIVGESGAREGMAVLDLGVGTGNLAARFVELGCVVWGIDFSAEMLAKARKKMPSATLMQADLLGEWPQELERRFEVIVSAYVLHEFPLEAKIELLRRLFDRYLVEDGRVVIGDIAFPTAEARNQARQKWIDDWDDSEFYWAAGETAELCQRYGFSVQYQQISSCGGVFIFARSLR